MPKKSASDTIRTVRPIIGNGKIDLAAIDTASTCGFKGDKAETIAVLTTLSGELARLQNVLYAEQRHKVLVVLQAMDTGGKDGTIRKVFSGINPQGVRIANFKAPTAPELAHDYLWRVHRQVPARGEIVVFNRSHYEDVLITRVHGAIDARTVKRRYRQINDFEAMLIEEGTVILKFFLHISKDEQRARLQDRVDSPGKQWKFDPVDLAERKHWESYQSAYQDAINATSTPHAPWYVVPADYKWLRDLYVASVVVDTLSGLKMQVPAPKPGLEGLHVE